MSPSRVPERTARRLANRLPKMYQPQQAVWDAILNASAETLLAAGDSGSQPRQMTATEGASLSTIQTGLSAQMRLMLELVETANKRRRVDDSPESSPEPAE